jgi:hypothetical protein
MEKQVAELLKNGMIQASTSLFASPVLLVKKKNGDWRLCVDYRMLNAYTVKDKFPLPVIDEFMDELVGAKWFTSLDMRSGFHQIRTKAEDRCKTIFQTHHGHFEYKVMPNGVTGACYLSKSYEQYLGTTAVSLCHCVHIRHSYTQ